MRNAPYVCLYFIFICVVIAFAVASVNYKQPDQTYGYIVNNVHAAKTVSVLDEHTLCLDSSIYIYSKDNSVYEKRIESRESFDTEDGMLISEGTTFTIIDYKQHLLHILLGADKERWVYKRI